MKVNQFLNDTEATIMLGYSFGALSSPPLVIFLQGELGAGKTTFVRGFLQGKGYIGIVKSPTFTLVEEYEFSQEKQEFAKENKHEFSKEEEYFFPKKDHAFTKEVSYELPKEETDSPKIIVQHFDLYRLKISEELESIGIRDYFQNNAIVIIEWAENGGKFLPKPDLILKFEVLNHGRSLEMVACTQMGENLLQKIIKQRE